MDEKASVNHDPVSCESEVQTQKTRRIGTRIKRIDDDFLSDACGSFGQGACEDRYTGVQPLRNRIIKKLNFLFVFRGKSLFEKCLLGLLASSRHVFERHCRTATSCEW